MHLKQGTPKMRTLNRVIVHCSYTPPSMDIGVDEIRKWHTDEPPVGNGWRDIGYHFVIRRDGCIEDGSPIAEVGAHTLGENADSIGICLVGGKSAEGAPEFNYTRKQMQSLRELVHNCQLRYNIKRGRIHGHNEYSTKQCPCFDVQEYFKEG